MGLFVIFVLLVVSISAGIAVGLGHTPRPRLLGYILVGMGLIVASNTVSAWARVLPGIFGIATVQRYDCFD